MRRSTILLRHYIYDIKMARATVLSGLLRSLLEPIGVLRMLRITHIRLAAADFFALLEH